MLRLLVASLALLSPAQAQSFEVASIKPNRSSERGVFIRNSPGGRFSAKNVTVKMLIIMSYKIQPFQLTGAPSWIDTEHFDIEATPEAAEAEPQNPSPDQMQASFEKQRIRVQSLLADRFKLKIHRETKELPVYALVVAKNGPKLKAAESSGAAAKGPRMRAGGGELIGEAVPISFLAQNLSNWVGRFVIDRTGLGGNYDFTLKWTPDENQLPRASGGDPTVPVQRDPSGPSLFTALQEQLGLKLEPQKGPVEILAIDQISEPTEN